jgi:hypothetical protein
MMALSYRRHEYMARATGFRFLDSGKKKRKRILNIVTCNAFSVACYKS